MSQGTEHHVEEAEHAQTVVDRDDHDALPSQCRAIVRTLRAATNHIRAAVNPNHHRSGILYRPLGDPDVEVQTILGNLESSGVVHGAIKLRQRFEKAPGAQWWLNAQRGRPGRVADALPALYRLRFTPTQIFHGRLSERNALEGDLSWQRRLEATLYGSASHPDNGRRRFG